MLLIYGIITVALFITMLNIVLYRERYIEKDDVKASIVVALIWPVWIFFLISTIFVILYKKIVRR